MKMTVAYASCVVISEDIYKRSSYWDFALMKLNFFHTSALFYVQVLSDVAD